MATSSVVVGSSMTWSDCLELTSANMAEIDSLLTELAAFLPAPTITLPASGGNHTPAHMTQQHPHLLGSVASRTAVTSPAVSTGGSGALVVMMEGKGDLGRREMASSLTSSITSSSCLPATTSAASSSSLSSFSSCSSSSFSPGSPSSPTSVSPLSSVGRNAGKTAARAWLLGASQYIDDEPFMRKQSTTRYNASAITRKPNPGSVTGTGTQSGSPAKETLSTATDVLIEGDTDGGPTIAPSQPFNIRHVGHGSSSDDLPEINAAEEDGDHEREDEPKEKQNKKSGRDETEEDERARAELEELQGLRDRYGFLYENPEEQHAIARRYATLIDDQIREWKGALL